MRRTDVRTVVAPPSPLLDGLHGLPSPYVLRRVGSWDELQRELRVAPPSTTALVAPLDVGPGAALAGRVHELVARCPLCPVIVVLELTPERSDDLQALLGSGVSEVVSLPAENHPQAVAFRLREAHARPLKRRLEAVVPRITSQDGLTLLYAAAEVAVDGGGAPELAERLGARTRTVARWCAREGLPPPRRLQAWVRLLLAAALVEEPARTVVGAALAAGYSTDHSFRRASRELLGSLPPRERAFETAASAFAAELRRRRSETKRAGAAKAPAP